MVCWGCAPACLLQHPLPWPNPQTLHLRNPSPRQPLPTPAPPPPSTPAGGAPLARHVEDFLRICMCCRVVQGYGLTETCAASFIAVPDVVVSHHGGMGVRGGG